MSCIFSRISGLETIRVICSLKTVMMVVGVFAGATNPYQFVDV